MKLPISRSWIGLCLALALIVLLPAAAQGAGQVPSGEGWELVGEGLWTRTLEDGTVETEAFGREGLLQVLSQLDAEMVTLVDSYLKSPSREMAEVLDTHLALIKRLEEGIVTAEKRAQEQGAAAPTCSTTYTATAAGQNPCTNVASALASYSGTSAAACFGLCDLYSYAYVSRTLCNDTVLTSSHSCSKPGVINQTCSSSVSLNNSPIRSCFANAFSSIYCPDISWYRSASQSSNSCGLCFACAIEEES